MKRVYGLAVHDWKRISGPSSRVADRRPSVGPWPGQARGVLMLNGLGTRGVLVGPAAAKCLVAWWLDGEELPDEMRATRFKSVRGQALGFQE